MVQLLEHGANPDNTEPVRKSSVLHWACEKGCMDMVDLLVKYKADVKQEGQCWDHSSHAGMQERSPGDCAVPLAKVRPIFISFS